MVALVLLAILAMLLVGGIVGMVAMIANPKTRAAGITLLTIGLLVLTVVGGAFALHFYRSAARQEQVMAHAYDTEQRMVAEAERTRAEMQRAASEAARDENGGTADRPEAAGESSEDAVAEAIPLSNLAAKPQSDTMASASGGARSHVSVVGLSLLPILALLLIGGIVGMVAMISNPKTRTAGITLLAIGLLVLAVVGVGAFTWSFSSTAPATRQEKVMTRGYAMEQRTFVKVERTRAGGEAKPKSDPMEAKAPAAEETSLASAPPPWVDAEPQPTADGDGYQMSIEVGPFLARADCDAELPEELQQATARYIADHPDFGPAAARRVRLSEDYIRSHIVQSEYEESVENPLGPEIKLDADEDAPWTSLHVLLEFDRKVNDDIKKMWKETIVQQRLWYAGTGLATILGLLAVVFGSLKIDQSTGGSCRGRLSVAAVAAVAAVLAAACFVAFSWLLPLHAGGLPHASEITIPVQSVSHSQSAPVAGPAQPWAIHRATDFLWFWIVAIPVVVLLLVGLVALLVNKKTRTAALFILGVLLVVGLAVALGVADFPVSIGPIELLVVTSAAAYLVLITALSRARWAWALGLVACLVVAAVFTPADPLSMLMVGVPLCLAYTIAAFARRAGRENPATDVPNRDAAEVAQV